MLGELGVLPVKLGFLPLGYKVLCLSMCVASEIQGEISYLQIDPQIHPLLDYVITGEVICYGRGTLCLNSLLATIQSETTSAATYMLSWRSMSLLPNLLIIAMVTSTTGRCIGSFLV